MPAADGNSRWVGVIIPVPEPLASELADWRASFGDPLAAVVPPHITLVTTTPTDDWEAAVEHVRRVAREQRPFTIRLQGTGTFRPVSPVVFVSLDGGFQECVNLHGKLQSGPLARELAFPFHPHVTVAQDVSETSMAAAEAKLRDYEAAFTVRTMGLYEHDQTGVWVLREELGFGDHSQGGQAAEPEH